MSYDPEDLQAGIVELFDNAARLSLRPWDFGTLPFAVALRDLRPLDATRVKVKITRVARTIITLTTKREAKPRSALVCGFCGARALAHRCPVAGWIA